MYDSEIIRGLSENKTVFNTLLSGLSQEIILWKPSPEKWCLLEIICHLSDEEKEDFRARIKHILDQTSGPLPSIDPQGWVVKRNYIQQNFSLMLNNFIDEREKSIHWLQSLSNPNWENFYDHPKFGKMTAKMFLANWLAHDFLHIRQIIKLKYDFLKHLSKEDLNYAGNW